jgi:hypothetical protein
VSSGVVFESGVAIVAESSGQLEEQSFFVVAEGALVTQTVLPVSSVIENQARSPPKSQDDLI